MTKVVSAYEARTKFGELLNLVYYKGEDVVVTKSGKSMVKIIKVEDTENLQKRANRLWKQLRKIAKEGKQIDGVAFLRRQRDRGYSRNY